MSVYIYESVNKQGETAKGKIEAESKLDVVQQLERQGLTALLIEKEGEVGKGRGFSLNLFETVKDIDRIFLVRNLSATIKAGMNILEAMDILIADTTKPVIKKILGQAKFNLQRGQPLSATFVQYEKFFPPVFVGLIKAGEASGRLDESLDKLNKYLTKEHSLSKKIKSALAYPAILMAASLGIGSMLVFFVLPRLAKSFAMSKVQLPLITRIVIGFSDIFTYSITLDIILLVGIVWSFLYFRKTKFGKRFLLKTLMKIPVAKDLVRKVALVRFTRTFGELVSSGINIMEAIDVSAETVSNDIYKEVILASKDSIKSGVPMSSVLKDRPDLFPHLLSNMAVVGERTGTLERVLTTFADFYEEEVDNTVKDLTTYLEPILLLFMGLVVGVIAISILLPIYQLVGKFV